VISPKSSSAQIRLVIFEQKANTVPQLENVPMWGKNILRGREGANTHLGFKNILNSRGEGENWPPLVAA